MNKPARVGLALGGGAARGWAHLGAIDVLREAEIEVACVAGTSIGSLVGGLLAAGQLEALRDMALNLDLRQVLYYFFEMSFPRSGLVDGRKIVAEVREYVKDTTFESLPIPLRTVATDLIVGEEVVLDRGDLVEGIRASIAIPGILTPVKRGKRILVDGGLVNPLPVSVVRRMTDLPVVAVDLNHRSRQTANRLSGTAPDETTGESPKTTTDERSPFWASFNEKIQRMDLRRLPAVREWMEKSAMPTIFDVLGDSIDIVEGQITEFRLQSEPADLLIRPDLDSIAYMEFHRAREAIDEGRRAASAALRQAGWM